ncbi:hypothetical protein D3C80_1675260 [compost metagenome]
MLGLVDVTLLVPRNGVVGIQDIEDQVQIFQSIVVPRFLFGVVTIARHEADVQAVLVQNYRDFDSFSNYIIPHWSFSYW